MILIEQLLTTKGRDIWSISPDATALEAIRLMEEKQVGALPVMEDGKLLGIISERDYVRRVVLKGIADTTPVRSIMTSKVRYAEPGQTVSHCMALMTEKRVRHLPVMSEGKMLGMISIGDLVKAMIVHQQHTIEELERYITG
ncbi:MAG: CBS domain-containing protein [Gammaproteobacteria bacterium]|nr:CBS domain-containing protein [Gammaproteobacteria bacterium]